MNTSRYAFHGKKYLLVFNTRVLVEMEDRGLSLASLSDEHANIRTTVTLLHLMLEAGDRYAQSKGIKNPGTVSLDELLDELSLDDLGEATTAIMEAMQGKRKVEAVPPKNAETTQEPAGK